MRAEVMALQSCLQTTSPHWPCSCPGMFCSWSSSPIQRFEVSWAFPARLFSGSLKETSFSGTPWHTKWLRCKPVAASR